MYIQFTQNQQAAPAGSYGTIFVRAGRIVFDRMRGTYPVPIIPLTLIKNARKSV
jgi:hypothetical protein